MKPVTPAEPSAQRYSYAVAIFNRNLYQKMVNFISLRHILIDFNFMVANISEAVLLNRKKIRELFI